jgi:hypothetical protein
MWLRMTMLCSIEKAWRAKDNCELASCKGPANIYYHASVHLLRCAGLSPTFTDGYWTYSSYWSLVSFSLCKLRLINFHIVKLFELNALTEYIQYSNKKYKNIVATVLVSKSSTPFRGEDVICYSIALWICCMRIECVRFYLALCAAVMSIGSPAVVQAASRFIVRRARKISKH